MLRIALALVAATLFTACQANRAQGPLPTGNVMPTVAGRAPAPFADAEAAREAFTRRTENEEFAASLEDVAWLRYEGTPEDVEKNHRAYFEEGYTTFQVLMSIEEFTQPTKETFVLEDSSGRRVVSKPVTYRSAMASGRDAFTFTFNLSFQHAVTADTRWLTLTRQADGASLRWDFR